MLSRTADHLFRMVHCIERADNRGNAAVAAQVKARSAGRSQDTRQRDSAAGCSRPGDDNA